MSPFRRSLSVTGSPLMHACIEGDAEDIRELLESGKEFGVDELYSNIDRTPLIIAAESGEAEMVKVLLEAGAEVE